MLLMYAFIFSHLRVPMPQTLHYIEEDSENNAERVGQRRIALYRLRIEYLSIRWMFWPKLFLNINDTVGSYKSHKE
jgi:hypothetical protein